MKFPAFAFVFLATWTAAEGDWKMEGGAAYAKDVKAAVKNSIEIAKAAVDILETKYDDSKVQSMMKHIYGANGFDTKVKQAKTMLEGVSQYQKDEYPFLGGLQPPQNTDVFDLTNYKPNSRRQIISDKLFRLIPDPNYQMIKLCHDTVLKAGDLPEMPMAITISSDGVDEPALLAAGQNADPRDFPLERKNKANTMDLCDWYLREIAGSRMVEVNDATIARVQEQSFINGQEGNEKPIDGLTETLAGTILHEFTHTNLGGLSRDEPVGQCYGWVCVGNIHNGRNADSATHLAVCMYLYSKGFWVDGGKVKPV